MRKEEAAHPSAARAPQIKNRLPGLRLHFAWPRRALTLRQLILLWPPVVAAAAAAVAMLPRAGTDAEYGLQPNLGEAPLGCAHGGRGLRGVVLGMFIGQSWVLTRVDAAGCMEEGFDIAAAPRL